MGREAQDFILQCNLVDVHTYGVHFTWTNNRRGIGATYEKLDRAMVDKNWRALFPKAAALCLPV